MLPFLRDSLRPVEGQKQCCGGFPPLSSTDSKCARLSQWADVAFEYFQITRSLLFASKIGSKLEIGRRSINLKYSRCGTQCGRA